MTELLLSGHNTQESTFISRPLAATGIKQTMHESVEWVLRELGGDLSDFDPTLSFSEVVQGWVYINVDYYVRNAGRVFPFDPESVGVPAELITEQPKVPLGRQLRMPGRFWRLYRWAADYYRQTLPEQYVNMRDLYWALHDEPEDPLVLIWPLFEEEAQHNIELPGRAHEVISITIVALDTALQKNVPELLGLFAGSATTTSLMGQRVWELRELAEQCGPAVTQKLQAGVSELDVYAAMPEATPFVKGVQAFLKDYGHRGFRYELDFSAERLAEHPEHVLLAVASQLSEGQSPKIRAEAARRTAEKALNAMNPVKRALWSRLLTWAQRLISWREDSKSYLSLGQAIQGLVIRYLGQHFYPNDPDDILMFYTFDEFLDFVHSRGEQKVSRELLDRRRARFDLHYEQVPPPELIWFDPDTGHWRPAIAEEKPDTTRIMTHFKGIPASAGTGPVEGIALVINDPVDAAQRLLALDGPVVLITHLTDPAWSSLFARLTAVVTELGGVISHAAIVARENGLPAVVGVPEITHWMRNGARVRVDGAAGTVEILD